MGPHRTVHIHANYTTLGGIPGGEVDMHISNGTCTPSDQGVGPDQGCLGKYSGFQRYTYVSAKLCEGVGGHLGVRWACKHALICGGYNIHPVPFWCACVFTQI